MRHSILELEDVFGLEIIDGDSLQELRDREMICFISPYTEPKFSQLKELFRLKVDSLEEMTLKEFKEEVEKVWGWSKENFPISKEIYERNKSWIDKQSWGTKRKKPKLYHFTTGENWDQIERDNLIKATVSANWDFKRVSLTSCEFLKNHGNIRIEFNDRFFEDYKVEEAEYGSVPGTFPVQWSHEKEWYVLSDINNLSLYIESVYDVDLEVCIRGKNERTMYEVWRSNLYKYSNDYLSCLETLKLLNSQYE